MRNNIDSYLEKMRSEFEDGEFAAGYEAATACLLNDVPIPDWLKPLVEDALAWGFDAPRGKAGSMETRSSKRIEAQALVRRVDQKLALRGNEKLIGEVFQEISDEMNALADDERVRSIEEGRQEHKLRRPNQKAIEQAYYRAKRAQPFRFIPKDQTDD